MITQHDKNRRPNIEILESYICFQNIKTVPGNRIYASTTKCEKKICIVWGSHIKHIIRNIFNDSINHEKRLLKFFYQGKYLTPQPLHIDSNDSSQKCGSFDINTTIEGIISTGKNGQLLVLRAYQFLLNGNSN